MLGIFEGVSRLGLKKWSPLNMELPDAYKTGTIFWGATQEPDDFTNFTVSCFSCCA